MAKDNRPGRTSPINSDNFTFSDDKSRLKNLSISESTDNALPNNAAGLAQFYNLMLMARQIKIPKHLRPVIMALMDERIRKLLIILGPGSGKSNLISQIFPAFVLGQDPSMTILELSAGEDLVKGFLSAVMEYIENDPMWKMLFPKVTPDKNQGWSADRGMFVTGHRAGDPDASIFACGLGSKALTGKHARLLIGDDLHDRENSNSSEACLKVVETFYRQIMGRADPQGARFIFAGRRWHENDLYGHLKATGEWVVMELPALRENAPDLYWDVFVPDDLICCLNEGAYLDAGQKEALMRSFDE